MRMFPLVLAAVLGVVFPALADENQAPPVSPTAVPAPAVAPATVKPAPEEDRMICKAERTIGSNRVQRICRSAAQIEREREAARSELGKAQVGG